MGFPLYRLPAFQPKLKASVTEGNLGFPLFVGGEARVEGERRPYGCLAFFRLSLRSAMMRA